MASVSQGDAMPKFGFIDTDSHVIEPDNLWQKYLDRKYRDEAPVTRVGYKNDERGFGFYNDVTVGGINMPLGFFGTTAVMPDLGEVYDEYARQGFPARTYVDAMDKTGIDYMVLYPTACLYTNEAPSTKADVAAAYRRAYNNWLHDFCSDGEHRLIGAGALDLRDPDAAGKEAIRSVTDLGFKAVTINPTPVGGPPLYDPAMDRLWATISDLDVPVGVHCGALNAADKLLYDYFPNLMHAQSVSAFVIGNMIACTSFIIGGVLERHPKLRIAHLEAGSGWVAFWLYRLQVAVQGGNKGITIPGLTMEPIDYWRRQCFISTEPGDPGIKQVIDAVGDDNIVIATDFSHPEGRNYSRAPKEIKELPDVSDTSKRKLMWDNALKLYPLDVS
jgi:predicted TIM-barrel fold metal-dependent hydrolase